jgi:hypothetical protein
MVTGAPFGVHQVVAELSPDRYAVIVIPVWPGLALVQVRELGEYK